MMLVGGFVGGHLLLVYGRNVNSVVVGDSVAGTSYGVPGVVPSAGSSVSGSGTPVETEVDKRVRARRLIAERLKREREAGGPVGHRVLEL